MITDVDINRFATHSLKDPRILRILSAALQAVDPFEAVQKHLPEITGRVYGLGIGKAAVPMILLGVELKGATLGLIGFGDFLRGT